MADIFKINRKPSPFASGFLPGQQVTGGLPASVVAKPVIPNVPDAPVAPIAPTAPNVPVTPSPTVPNEIDVQGLDKKAMNFPEAPPVDDGASFVQSIEAVLEKQSTLDLEREKQIQEAMKAAQSLTGIGARRADIEKQLGIPETSQQLQELNLQIAERTAAFRALEEKAAPQGVSLTSFLGAQGAVRRQAAIEIGNLSIRQAALQDNIRLAEDRADRLIEFEFAPVQQQIDNTKLFLELNADRFDKEDAKKATKIQLLLQQRQDELDEKKSAKKQITDLMIQNPDANIKPSDTLEEALAKVSESPSFKMGAEAQGLELNILKSKLSGEQLANQLANEKIKQAKNAVETGALTKEQMKSVNDLADDLRSEPLYRKMLEIQNGFLSVDSGFDTNDAFGDLIMVNGFQRMIDPGAVVREGEFKTVEEAQGFLRSTLNLPKKFISGDRLTEDARAQMLNAAVDLFNIKADSYNTTVGATFKLRAKDANVPFDRIGQDFSLVEDEEDTRGNEETFGNEFDSLSLDFKII